MAKKTFANPAERFISSIGVDNEESATEVEQLPIPEPAGESAKPSDTSANSNVFKPVSTHPETKSKRLQLVLKPSLVDRLKASAAESGLSVNEYLSQLIDTFAKKI